jgi:hypothetical protein
VASLGEGQEGRAKEFVRKLGCGEVIVGEGSIKSLLKMTVIGGPDTNCADIVGFRPNLKNAISAIVCESKGTDVHHALVQLGNVAAAMLEYFAAERRLLSDLVLLVYRSSVRKLDIGDSPGPGYITGVPSHSGMRTLIDAGTAEKKAAPATASVDLKRLDARLTKWSGQVNKLPVYIYVEP